MSSPTPDQADNLSIGSGQADNLSIGSGQAEPRSRPPSPAPSITSSFQDGVTVVNVGAPDQSTPDAGPAKGSDNDDAAADNDAAANAADAGPSAWPPFTPSETEAAMAETRAARERDQDAVEALADAAQCTLDSATCPHCPTTSVADLIARVKTLPDGSQHNQSQDDRNRLIPCVEISVEELLFVIPSATVLTPDPVRIANAEFFVKDGRPRGVPGNSRLSGAEIAARMRRADENDELVVRVNRLTTLIRALLVHHHIGRWPPRVPGGPGEGLPEMVFRVRMVPAKSLPNPKPN